MFNVGDYVIYRRDVCVIKSIMEKYFKDVDYYELYPVDDPSLIIKVPVNNSMIKSIISKDEALEIIDGISEVECLNLEVKSLENEYRELLNSEDIMDLVKVIKTTYLRNQDRLEHGKKIGDKDDGYFKKAEKYLYNILSISLGMSFDDCRDYVIKKVEEKKGK